MTALDKLRELLRGFCFIAYDENHKRELTEAELEALLPLIAEEQELQSCDNCQECKPTVFVLTGFSGEREKLCGDCLSKERDTVAEEQQLAVAVALERAAKLCLAAKVRPDGSCAGHTILDCHNSDAYWIRSIIPADTQAALAKHDAEVAGEFLKTLTDIAEHPEAFESSEHLKVELADPARTIKRTLAEVAAKARLEEAGKWVQQTHHYEYWLTEPDKEPVLVHKREACGPCQRIAALKAEVKK